MERIKKVRSAQRTAFTKIYNAMMDMLAETTPDVAELEGNLRMLDQKAENLNELNKEMSDALLAASCSSDDLDNEIAVVDEYSNKYNRVRIRLERLLRKERSETASVSDVSVSVRRKLKLPTIEFHKFGGEIKSWLSFWSQFQRVHDDESIDNEDKFQYLIQATIPNSRARQLIESYPPTCENYPKAIESLKSRFGRNDLLVEVYVRELLSLILNNMHKKIKLSELYDKMESQLRALETLGVTSETCAAMLYPMVESCLPEEILRVWQRSNHFSNTISLKDRLKSLMDFLKAEVENEERISLAVSGFDVKKGSEKCNKKNMYQHENAVATAAGLLNQKYVPKCVFCAENHPSSECDDKKYSHEEKSRILKERGCCFICLRFGHMARKCRSRIKCSKCKGRHSPVICDNENRVNSNPSSTPSESLSNHTHGEVFLQTLLVKVIGETNTRLARAIIDTGSQRSYITKVLSREMNYEPIKDEYLAHSLFGGVKSETVKHTRYHVRLCNSNDKYKCDFDVLDQDVICNNLGCIIQGPWINELEKLNISISDRNTGPIEILIGADVAGKLLTGKRYSLNCGLVAVEMSLGWTLMGKIPQNVSQNSSMLVTSLLSKDFSICDYWQLDVLGITDPYEQMSKKDEELAVMNHFLRNVTVNKDGRYEVKMPWIEGHPPLPNYLDLAEKRLGTLCAKLKKDGYYEAYHQVFCEWMEEGIIEKVPEDEIDKTATYLPHRHVLKLNSNTTKIRPVFYASAKLRNHPSLNQCLEKGVNLIELIPSLLLRFRLHQIGVTSDIRKAFLQISLTPGDRDFLRFLWYDAENRIEHFRHCRVVFGVTCSPFLLSSVIKFHLEDVLSKKENNRSQYSTWVILKLKKSFYVDNCVTSVDNLDELYTFIREASNLMLDGMFDLRGWEHTISENLPDQVNLRSTQHTPVLGLLWDRNKNELMISNEFFEESDTKTVTKRSILSSAHRLFDPIGFTSPVSLFPKLLLQKLWQTKIGWDTEVEGDNRIVYLRWLEELPILRDLNVPRWLGYQPQITAASLHVFCDGSQDAYAAAIFLRIEIGSTVMINLVQAKSRVSPVKKLTIPRLELMAATIGARLSETILKNIHLDCLKVYWWTDSTTVLSWIKADEVWKPFVWNRVQEIRKLTDKNSWYHVPGDCNPADLPSRGCTPKKLLESRWWEGPTWLKKPMEEWPVQQFQCDEGLVYSEKKKILSSLLITESRADFVCFYRYFSKYNSIVKVVGYVRRFIHNCRNRNDRKLGIFSVEEFCESEMQLVKFIQLESFDGVADTRLSSFCPFLDEKGIIRLKTRISELSESTEFCNPMVLPAKHPVVTKLIYDSHLKYSHVGIQGLLSILRERFWIIRGRKSIRSVLHKCVICKRFDSKKLETSPVALPHDRVKDAVVFEVTGVDFAGPLFIRNGDKVWICIFTCGVYRALHLELVSSLSTDLFIQAFRRFVARRGRPSVIYSDHGTNFVGADNSFSKLDWKAISEYSTVQRIQWKFNPVTAAWWGGWWERLIRLVKQLLRKILGRACLSYEELATVLCDCESVLNSRPITYVSENASDLIPLTPDMFLRDMGPKVGLTNELPDVNMIESSYLSRHARYRQKLRDNLRLRFRQEYLGELILHSKKRSNSTPVKIGSIVLIGNDNTKRIDWPLAMVEELLPGKDGIVRLVRLKTKSGHLLRPIQRIFPLEIDAEDSKSVNGSIAAGETDFSTSSESKPLEDEKETKTEDKPQPVLTRYGRKVTPPERFSY